MILNLNDREKERWEQKVIRYPYDVRFLANYYKGKGGLHTYPSKAQGPAQSRRQHMRGVEYTNYSRLATIIDEPNDGGSNNEKTGRYVQNYTDVFVGWPWTTDAPFSSSSDFL